MFRPPFRQLLGLYILFSFFSELACLVFMMALFASWRVGHIYSLVLCRCGELDQWLKNSIEKGPGHSLSKHSLRRPHRSSLVSAALLYYFYCTK